MKWLSILLILVSLYGCRGNREVEEYGRDFNTIMQEFESGAIELSQTPDPDFTGLNRRERMNLVADRIQEMTDLFRRSESRIDELESPKDARELHASAKMVFSAPAEIQEQIVADMRAGRQPSVTLSDATRSQLTALEAFHNELVKLAGPQPELEAQLRQLREMVEEDSKASNAR